MVGGLIKLCGPQVGGSVGEGNVGWQADKTASQAIINPNSFSLYKITLILLWPFLPFEWENKLWWI
jgi:hypothetical protein